MCFPDQMDYKYDKELPDLDGMNQFQMPLTAIQKDQLTNLTMTFSVLQENILNIHWTYANDTG